ncbi:bifunctional RNase H/acid phosphatase [Streptomyces litchfieldiae]|uniref:Bifunctional RNase H/acid phosphatase n=1 Tax=Streptomyces litchfieldiae TaxID=3075543 RepID=A0ABU2MXU1_9ACTN|nr:bifunctional RNase H/acid phosphatase [Streptomyces sp. DSM 44938]MDT0346321.1 bifunctional RNase H/acid phosphatase [Streptomyces sp. DSM 44938]
MREFIVEADGGSRGNPGPAGYGALVRDAATGRVLAESAEFIGTATNNVAEYRGLIAGLRAAYALDPDATVRVRMDSKLVVEQMSGRWQIKHPAMRPLALEAREVFPASAVRYEWIPRERNKDADRLANEAMDAGRRGEVWQPRRQAEPEAAPPPAAVGWGPATGTPTTLLLLRHGETALTPQKRFSGSGGDDPPLSDTGRRQAEAVAEALAAAGVQAIVSSPLARCRGTAEPLAARLGLNVRYEEGFRETDFGAWEGLTFAEARERHPRDIAAWLASPDAEPTGGGESFTAVARRVAVARDKTIARHAGRTVLLVTHVTPVKTLLRLALDAPPAAMFRMELAPAALSEIAYYPDGNASVRRFNDTGHLERSLTPR